MAEVQLSRRQALGAALGTLASVALPRSVYAAATEEDPLDLPPGAERVCLSLRTLAKQASAGTDARVPLPTIVESMSGIGYVEGYVVDESGPEDVVLFGRRIKGRPSLHLDDLVVNMRNIAADGVYPHCSLDPLPKNVRAMQTLCADPPAIRSLDDVPLMVERLRSTLGPQQTRVGGVPRNSRLAHVMIDADYHMKKVSQGLVSLPQVDSYLDVALKRLKESVAAGRAAPSGAVGMARFWFHVGRNAPTYQEDNGIVLLSHCPVVVLTEKQMADPTGDLRDAGHADPNATAFSETMSRHFARLTSLVPVYAELENLFRLRALLLAMNHRAALKDCGLAPSSYLDGYAARKESALRPEFPALANHLTGSDRTATRVLYFFPIVCGGVGMDMTVRKESFRKTSSDRLLTVRRKILLSRPSPASLSWVLPQTA